MVLFLELPAAGHVRGNPVLVGLRKLGGVETGSDVGSSSSQERVARPRPDGSAACPVRNAKATAAGVLALLLGWLARGRTQGAAAAAGVRVVLQHLIHPLDRQQLRSRAGMARLPAPLAAIPFAPLRRLEPSTIAGGRFGGVARGATNPLAQAGQFRRQGGELRSELFVLLLLPLELSENLKEASPHTHRSGSPVRF
jgi:hypothetical protein